MRKKIFIILFIQLSLTNCKEERMEIKLNNVELSNGKYVETKDLTEEQFNSILKESDKVERIYNDITLSDSSITIYEINNDTIIVSSDGYYSLYKNIADLRLVIHDYEGYEGNGIELLYKKNIYKDKFPLSVDSIITNYLFSLDMKFNEHYTLKEIDKVIPNYENKYFLEYVALVGKEIISNYNGSWEMRLSNDGETWNPYIVVNNQQIDLIAYVYEDIFENNYKLIECYNSIKEIIEFRNDSSDL